MPNGLLSHVDLLKKMEKMNQPMRHIHLHAKQQNKSPLATSIYSEGTSDPDKILEQVEN